MAQQTINTPRDTTFNTTENTPRNLADVLADELSGIASELANLGSDDYDDLTNKPQVNGVTLSGNKSSDDLSLAAQSDLTSIKATGTTNATGATISKGTYFYLNGTLCQAKVDIASGATFTLNTNYEVVTAGGLNSLNSALTISKYEASTFTVWKIGKTVHFISKAWIVSNSSVPPEYKPDKTYYFPATDNAGAAIYVAIDPTDGKLINQKNSNNFITCATWYTDL